VAVVVVEVTVVVVAAVFFFSSWRQQRTSSKPWLTHSSAQARMCCLSQRRWKARLSDAIGAALGLLLYGPLFFVVVVAIFSAVMMWLGWTSCSLNWLM
jgi:hypothetical protein